MQIVGLISTPTNFCQFKEPPLLGPGAAFPPFGAAEFHPTTPENWKGATIHPTGLMKEPAVVPGRNAPVTFATQAQGQVSSKLSIITRLCCCLYSNIKYTRAAWHICICAHVYLCMCMY